MQTEVFATIHPPEVMPPVFDPGTEEIFHVKVAGDRTAPIVDIRDEHLAHVVAEEVAGVMLGTPMGVYRLQGGCRQLQTVFLGRRRPSLGFTSRTDVRRFTREEWERFRARLQWPAGVE